MVKKIILITISFLTILIIGCARNQTNNLQQQIAENINAIIKQANLPEDLGILIIAPKTDSVYYSLNSAQSFVPASNLKLFTAAAALIYLGPDFTFRTTLAIDNKSLTAQQITGNAYLKFTGDPDLMIKDLSALLNTLQKQNITTIKGNLYLDTSTMDGENYGPGWMWDELNWCYAAPITSIMLDHNCINFGMIPNRTIGANTRLVLLPKYFQFISVTNSVITAKDNDNCNISIKHLQQNNYQLNGCISQTVKIQDVKLAIRDPNLFAVQVIKNLLQENHIRLLGKVSIGQMPKDATIIAVHESRPLKILIKQMLKKSDNQIAGILLKTLGNHYYHDSGNWQNGVKAVEAILNKDAGINFQNSTIVDGAGISRYNLITPQQTAQLLQYIFNNKKLARDFIASLPIAGVDGTLNNRMQTKDIQGKVSAKTGTMTGVSSLSGFVTTKHHGVLLFVIFGNNFVAPISKATELEDNICRYLASL